MEISLTTFYWVCVSQFSSIVLPQEQVISITARPSFCSRIRAFGWHAAGLTAGDAAPSSACPSSGSTHGPPWRTWLFLITPDINEVIDCLSLIQFRRCACIRVAVILLHL